MFYKLKADIIFRDYDGFGYITDNRNFGYKPANDSGNDIGDKIISSSGTVFLTVLGRKPKELERLVQELCLRFTDVDYETIRGDAEEFYKQLEEDGFLVSGKTADECERKDSISLCAEPKKRDSKANPLQVVPTPQEYLDQYFGGVPQLTHLHMEITGKCNERCIHCYIPHESKICHMPPNLFYDILEQCRKMNVLHLTISGGEPMLHPDFAGFLQRCNELNFSVNILSNLTLLDENILTVMRQNHLLCVQTSLYAMDAAIHDSITNVNGSFEKTMRGILTLLDHNVPLQISCPIMKQNVSCYHDVVKWGKAHNVNVNGDYVIIGQYDHSPHNLASRLDIDEIEHLIRLTAAQDTHYWERTASEADKKRDMTPDDYICSVCQASICVSETGMAYPCAGWQGYILGDLKTTSLREIWDCSPAVQYLRGLRRRDFPQCIDCKDKEFCTMCMVRNANEDPAGDLHAVNPFFCRIAALNRELFFEHVQSNNSSASAN